MELKAVAGDEIAAAATAAEKAFGVSPGSWRPGWYAMEDVLGPDAVWAVYDNAHIVCACVAPRQRVWFGQTAVAGGAVGGVGTLPEERNKGYAEALMRGVLHAARERGVLINYLWPFSYRYYRKVGWELAGDALRLTLDREHIDKLTPAGSVREVDKRDIQALMELWAPYAQRFNGSGERTEANWVRLIAQNWPPGADGRGLLFGEGSRAFGCWQGKHMIGYALWSAPDNPQEPPVVREMAYLDGQAVASLIGAVAEARPDASGVSWDTSTDAATHFLTPEPPHFNRQLRSGPSARVLDPLEFLKAVRWTDHARGHLALRITDPVFGESRVAVEVEDGQASRAPATGEDLACDIQTFTQIATGYLRPETACLMGKIPDSQIPAARLLAHAAGGRTPFRSRQELG